MNEDYIWSTDPLFRHTYSASGTSISHFLSVERSGWVSSSDQVEGFTPEYGAAPTRHILRSGLKLAPKRQIVFSSRKAIYHMESQAAEKCQLPWLCIYSSSTVSSFCTQLNLVETLIICSILNSMWRRRA